MKTQGGDDFEVKRALDALPRSIEPPADAWPAVRARIAARPSRRAPYAFIDWLEQFQPRTIRLAAGLATIGIGLGVLGWQTRVNAHWRIIGAPRYATRGVSQIASGRRFEVGATLVTPSQGNAGAMALLEVGSIGRVELASATRVRLLAASAAHHRLALERGMIHARIDAPPRLFIVETPAGIAVDLGCEYTLHVDSAGNSVLHVQLGWVEYGGRGRQALVPAGYMAVARPGLPMGIPVEENASNRVRWAADIIGRGDGEYLDSAVAFLARSTSRYDGVTLWHALPAVSGVHRERLYDALAQLAPPPAAVTREGVLRGDRIMMRLWWEALPGTLPITPTWTRRAWAVWLKVASWM